MQPFASVLSIPVLISHYLRSVQGFCSFVSCKNRVDMVRYIIISQDESNCGVTGHGVCIYLPQRSRRLGPGGPADPFGGAAGRRQRCHSRRILRPAGSIAAFGGHYRTADTGGHAPAGRSFAPAAAAISSGTADESAALRRILGLSGLQRADAADVPASDPRAGFVYGDPRRISGDRLGGALLLSAGGLGREQGAVLDPQRVYLGPPGGGDSAGAVIALCSGAAGLFGQSNGPAPGLWGAALGHHRRRLPSGGLPAGTADHPGGPELPQ